MAVALVPGEGTTHRTALATTRTRYTLSYTPAVVQVYCASANVYLEQVDSTDGVALGSTYETIPAGAKVSRTLHRGEFCLAAASGTPTVEVTAEVVG